MTRTAAAAAIVLLLLAGAALPASLSKTYSYFSVRGDTIEQLEREMDRRGPQVKSTGRRHPGATRMEFDTRYTLEGDDRRCRVSDARVSVKANVILPRWKRSRRASRETAIIWDTLAADIKRHEESHVVIARNHARKLENALKALRGRRGCDALRDKAQDLTTRILAEHDEAQARFDRVEGINFERRMLRLLRYRIERIESGRLNDPG